MEKKIVNAMGDVCPVPLVKAKNAIAELPGSGKVEVLVDNEIAVQNLEKMAQQKGYGFLVKEEKEKEYHVELTVSEKEAAETEEETVCLVPAAKKTKLVVLSNDHMGEGAEELGKILMKSFLYALTQQDELPDTILCYNGGAKLTCEGSESLEDLKDLAERGVEILTCGTCLNFYGITEKLQVGGVTNMYDIVERMGNADRVVKP
ncbi:sulfurtransferase-like selenium metabolism protein YedF [Fusicatenibacter sp.]